MQRIKAHALGVVVAIAIVAAASWVIGTYFPVPEAGVRVEIVQ